MYICSKCNYTSDDAIRFCPLCSSVMNEHITAFDVPNKSSLPKKIVGMALSIDGFVGTVLVSYFILLISLASVTDDVPNFISLIITIYFSLFGLPPSIIGLTFSNQARNLGDTSKFSSTGKGLGTAGIILWTVCYAISILILFV